MMAHERESWQQMGGQPAIEQAYTHANDTVAEHAQRLDAVLVVGEFEALQLARGDKCFGSELVCAQAVLQNKRHHAPRVFGRKTALSLCNRSDRNLDISTQRINVHGLEQIPQHAAKPALQSSIGGTRTCIELLALRTQLFLHLNSNALLPCAQLRLPSVAFYIVLECWRAALHAVLSVLRGQLCTIAAHHAADGQRAPALRRVHLGALFPVVTPLGGQECCNAEGSD